MPKKLVERKIINSVSKTANTEEIKEELTQRLFSTILKKGHTTLTFIAIITIVSLIIVYLYKR